MDFFLYGIFVFDLLHSDYIFDLDYRELLRTPFVINLGILGAVLVPMLAQTQVRTGLIALGLFSLFVTTGAIFLGTLFFVCCLLFLLARLLHAWSVKRGSIRLPHLTAWIVVTLLYLPTFFIIYPSFDGHMAAGELVLFWGVAFTVFRAIHYLHWSCKGDIDPFGEKAFSRFLHYMVHFPSFWFGPYQRFDKFDHEVSTCKERINWSNRLQGAKRISYGLVKIFITFHISLPYFYTALTPKPEILCV